MKKVLIIPSWYPSVEQPWSGTFFREQALLAEDSFDIRILAVKTKKTGRANRMLNAFLFSVSGKVKIRKLPHFYLEPPQVFGFACEDKISRFKKLNFRYELETYRSAFKQILKSWKPDLIHAQGVRPAGIISYYLHKDSGIPYTITEHNQPAFSKQAFIDTAYLKAIRGASKVFMVSKNQKQTLISKGINVPVEVVGNFVDDRKFKLSAHKLSGIFTILFVGFFIKEKDYPTLIATIKEFSKQSKNTDFRFQIIGCGEDGKEYILQELQNMEILQHLEIHPFVPREEIPEFHRSCDVFLSTSVFETFGLAMCETMMCGRPVVSTDNGGFDEMFISGVNGIKCRVGDAIQLAEALIALQKKEIVFDPVAIRNSVLEKFGTKAFRQKLLKVYNEALNN